MEIGEIIACNLKRLREERNLSLGQLAEMAGVSKVMLSQLEKGTSNPTINTIWKIAGALQIPYSSLLDAPKDHIIHVHKRDVVELEDEKFHIFSYYARGSERNLEVYQVEMDPGCVHPSIGHLMDSSEYIMVIEGKMELDVNGKTYILETDDGFCFNAAAPHTYKNTESKKVKMVMLNFYTQR